MLKLFTGTANPKLSNVAYKTMAAKNWGEYKKKNDIVTGMGNKNMVSNNKNDTESDSYSDSEEDAKPNNKKAVAKPPPQPHLTSYQQFIQTELPKIKKQFPQMSQSQCLVKAATAWKMQKQPQKIITGGKGKAPAKKIVIKAESDSESSEEPPKPVPKSMAPKKGYISSEGSECS